MALPNTNITPGAPPLLWSDVKSAFDKINENFDSLAATIGGGSGLTPVDFATLNTDVSPAYDNTYTLGALGTNRWKTVFVAEYHNSPGDTANGVYLGSAHIKGIGSHVDLPNNSTVNGQLIIDPDKTFFKSVQVDNGEQVVANSFVDTLNLISGSGINMTVDSGAESITIDNTGVLSIADGAGISHTTVNGIATIINAGVTSLTNTTTLPTGRSAGAGVHVSSSAGNIAVTNTGVLSIEAGSAALTISTDAATGIVTITNAAPAGNTFRYVVVNGDTVSPIEADSVADILNFTAGQGITLSKNTTTDTVTFTVNPIFDLKGSIFGDDSSILVDAVANEIRGNINTSRLRTGETEIRLGAMPDFASPVGGPAVQTVAIGAFAGEIRQNTNAIAIGYIAANEDQGDHAIAIGVNAGGQRQGSYGAAFGVEAAYRDQGVRALALGYQAGAFTQGAEAVAIGKGAGHTNQPANSIVINASGTNLNGSAAGLFINPVRNQTGASGVVQYDSTTKEVSYSSALGTVSGTLSGTFTGNIFTSLIDTADSTAITVTPKTIFSSDVDIENELRVRGSMMISVNQLKALAAASADFDAFKIAIAALTS